MVRAVLKVYEAAGGVELPNDAVYGALVDAGVCSRDELEQRVPIGKAGERHSTMRREARWAQQTLRRLGKLQKGSQRGRWRLGDGTTDDLTQAPAVGFMIAFSTDLGVALWARAHNLPELGERIDLYLSSPPYPLAQPRKYGNPKPGEFIDFMCRALEPVVRQLRTGGVVALNLGNEIFEEGSPARSTYIERLVIALEDRMGLALMERGVWVNPQKPPGPIQWASKRRMQLNAGYEPVLWFCNEPGACQADNRRVLKPHTPQQAALIDGGGEKRSAVYGDGAYRIKPGSFGNRTEGAIPRNVFAVGHASSEMRELRRKAQRHGLPLHGAMMPVALARTLVEFLSPPGGLVVDSFGGWLTTAVAAEAAGRRWICGDLHAEYLAAAAMRFGQLPVIEIG